MKKMKQASERMKKIKAKKDARMKEQFETRVKEELEKKRRDEAQKLQKKLWLEEYQRVENRKGKTTRTTAKRKDESYEGSLTSLRRRKKKDSR